MLRRRRPLLRAAMVGGAGYMAGRRTAERAEREAYQDQQLTDLQQAQSDQRYTAPSAAAPAGQDRLEALSKLKQLLDSGVLTQDEFAAEKARILQGG